MMHTAKLKTGDDGQFDIEPLPPEWFREICRDHNYNYEVLESFIVVNQKHGESNSGYVVTLVETTVVPFEQADIAADSTVLPLCSCPSALYHHAPENPSETIEDASMCKHAKEIQSKAEKAKSNPNQDTL